MQRRSLVVIVGLCALVLGVFASLCVGVLHVGPGEVLNVITDALVGRGGDSTARTLVLEMRLPRAIGALVVGCGLGAAGCVLQALLRDPLASPTIIGTAQAAGFGRVLGVYLGWTFGACLVVSYATALAGTLLVLIVSRARRGFASQTVLLTGVNVGLFFAALIGLVQFLSRDEGQLSRMVSMLLGGLWQITWAPLRWIAPTALVGVVLAALAHRHLDLSELGEEGARRLGLDTRRSGTLLLLVACGLTTLAVSIAGIVAFVGFVVPHAARRIVGPTHDVLVPASAVLGGLLVLATDALARTLVPPNELPLGVLTTLIGAPVFLLVLRSLMRSEGAT